MRNQHDFPVAWLQVFTEVARLGSFTAAGQALGYTQSAVSRQIAALEGELGAVLFDRLPRGVRPTQPGHSLLAHAQAVIGRLDAARRDLADLQRLAAGRLRLGAFATAGAVLVPVAVARFGERYPNVEVTVAEGLTPGHLAALAAGELDLAVVSAPPARGADGVDLCHLLDDAMYVALPLGHPLAGRERIGLADLAGEVWIAGSARPEETLISSCLRTGFEPRIGIVAADWMAKLGFVAAGLGVTLVPSLAVDAVRGDVALVALHPGDVPARPVCTATPQGMSRPPAVTAFLAELDAAVARLPRD